MPPRHPPRVCTSGRCALCQNPPPKLPLCSPRSLPSHCLPSDSALIDVSPIAVISLNFCFLFQTPSTTNPTQFNSRLYSAILLLQLPISAAIPMQLTWSRVKPSVAVFGLVVAMMLLCEPAEANARCIHVRMHLNCPIHRRMAIKFFASVKVGSLIYVSNLSIQPTTPPHPPASPISGLRRRQDPRVGARLAGRMARGRVRGVSSLLSLK